MASPRSRPRWAAALVGPSLALGVAAATLALDRDTGILPMLNLLDRVGNAEARVEALTLERGQLIQQVRGLRSDPYELEAAAREKLGMVRPGELVIRIEYSGAEPD